MFCEKCGKEIPEGSNWCPFCGKKNEEVITRYFRIAIGIIGALAVIFFFTSACFGFEQMGNPETRGYNWSLISLLSFLSLGFSVLSAAVTVYFIFKTKK